MNDMETMVEPRAISGHFRDMRQTDEGDKVFTFVASTSDPDRHGTVLNAKGWKLENFRANPIIGYMHNVYGNLSSPDDPDDVVGRGEKIYLNENDELILDMVFDQENEKARKIQSKVERGFLRTVSVGFIEVGEGRRGDKEKNEDPKLYYFEGQELLEVSIVNIPSNPSAKKKTLRGNTFDALRYIYRELGGNYRFSDIEGMTVRQVLDLLEGKEPEKPRQKQVRLYINGELLTDLTNRSQNQIK